MSNEEAMVFGGLVKQHQAVIARMIGPSALEDALATLFADQREELQDASTLSWCRQATLGALHLSCANISNLDVDKFVSDVVKGSMKETFRGIWKILFMVSSDEAIVRRSGLLYSKSVSRGKLVAEVTGEGKALVRLLDYPEIPHVECGCCCGQYRGSTKCFRAKRRACNLDACG